MAWVWLSFADSRLPTGTQFLGVAVVDGSDFMGAIEQAWLLGVNPGGEVLGRALPNIDVVPEEYRNRLLNRAETEALQSIIAKRSAN